jgi:hypothetical protein
VIRKRSPAVSDDAGLFAFHVQENRMFRTLRRFGATALAAVLALASCGAPAMAVQSKVVHVPAKASKPGNRGLFNDLVPPTTASFYGSKGAGIGMAHQQRAAAKKRNVTRNRRQHR